MGGWFFWSMATNHGGGVPKSAPGFSHHCAGGGIFPFGPSTKDEKVLAPRWVGGMSLALLPTCSLARSSLGTLIGSPQHSAVLGCFLSKAHCAKVWKPFVLLNGQSLGLAQPIPSPPERAVDSLKSITPSGQEENLVLR